MKKIAMLVVAAFAGVALTACGSSSPGETVTVTAPAPVVATPEPTTPEPVVEKTTEAPSIVQTVVQATWDNLTDEERSNICSLYDLSPDTAEESFREGYGEDADEAWPILAKILKKEC